MVVGQAIRPAAEGLNVELSPVAAAAPIADAPDEDCGAAAKVGTPPGELVQFSG